MKSLVRSLSLKLSRENLAAREKDVDNPPVLEEEQSEVDNAESEGDPQEFASKEEDLSDSKEDNSNGEVEEVEREEAEKVEPPADLPVVDSPPFEEAQDSLDVECQEETELTAESETREDGPQREEFVEASVSDSEQSQTLPRSRSDTDYVEDSHRGLGRPGLQGWIYASSPSAISYHLHISISTDGKSQDGIVNHTLLIQERIISRH